MFDKYLLSCKKKEERKSLLFVNEEWTRKEATSAKLFKKFFSRILGVHEVEFNLGAN